MATNMQPRLMYDPNNTMRAANPPRMTMDPNSYMFRQPRPMNPQIIPRPQPGAQQQVIRQHTMSPYAPPMQRDFQPGMYDNYNQSFIPQNNTGNPAHSASPPIDYNNAGTTPGGGSGNGEDYQYQVRPRLSPPLTASVQQQQQQQQQPNPQIIRSHLSSSPPLPTQSPIPVQSPIPLQQQPQSSPVIGVPMNIPLQYPLQTLPLQQPSSQPQPIPSQIQQQQPQEPLTVEQQYGIEGLNRVMKMDGNSDLEMLALGLDLMSLGLPLSTNDNIYNTFVSPLVDSGRSISLYPPNFSIPTCYQHIIPQLTESLFTHFSLRTLFYIFYTMPGDIAQAYAMKRLYENGWIYNKVEKKWYTTNNTKNNGYHYYDVDTWDDKPKWCNDPLPGPESNYATMEEVKENCPPLN